MNRYDLSPIWNAALLVAFALGLTTNAWAQERVINVDPGVGTLNEAIFGDTTDTGERIEPENTVYELEPGGLYLLQGTLGHRFPLYIRAPEGPRAQLVPAVGEGGESGRPFRSRDDVRLENLYITNRDEAGGFNTRIVRVSSDSARVLVDNCHLDFDAQSGFRLDNDWNVVKVTNSVISNIGRASSLNNGRGVDTRGNNVDTLIYHNNTFYNITSRLLRDGGGFIKYADVSRNTVYNVAQHGISFGEVQEVHMRDNFFINTGFLGQTDSTFGDRSIVDIDSLNPDREGDQVLDISHNFFYTYPEILDAHPDSVRAVQVVHPLSPAAEVIAGDPTNVSETASVEFVESAALGSSSDIAAVPAVPTNLIEEFWVAQTNALPEDDLPNMDDGEGGAIPANETLPFNFRYAESEPAATAAADGMPLGDRNWFDLVGVAVEETAEVPASHRLVGNYPNPFNPSTTIKFELASNADVTVNVFDVAGRKLMSLPAGAMSAGSAEVYIDAIDAPSGTYVYRVMIETGTETKVLSGTMTLLK